MEDINSAQDAILNNVAETPTKNNGRNDFWKSLLRTVLGISISITLTFGTNALLIHLRAVKDRKITAMMVVGNIETFANHLDQCADHMGWNDTLAAYLLAIPIDSLDFVDQNQLLFGINNVTAYYTLNHDKSAENIFSNSIDIWKNIGNFEFIENTGQCFSDIDNIKEIYDAFLSSTDRIRSRLIHKISKLVRVRHLVLRLYMTRSTGIIWHKSTLKQNIITILRLTFVGRMPKTSS